MGNMSAMSCVCGKLLSLSSVWKFPYVPKGVVSIGSIYRSTIHTTPTFGGRKKRDRLTVLNALASTVGPASRREHYQFFPDHNLQPKNYNERREFLAAIDYGTKAADYVLEKHMDLFPMRKPEPAWRKQKEEMETVEESVENLRYLMQSGDNVAKVVHLYDLLSKTGDINHDIHVDVLEYISFHAVTTMSQKENISGEDSDDGGSVVAKEEHGYNTIVARIFDSVKEKGARAYEVYILGLLKNREIFPAFKIYKQLNDKKLRGSLYLYNTLLEHVYDAAESDEDRWNLVQDITRVMNENKVKPNLITFNNLLSISAQREEDSTMLSLKVIREMRRMKITPSLGSYYYLLHADRTSDIKILVSIIEDIKDNGAEFTLQHPSDLLFLNKAMSFAKFKSADVLAEELLSLVLDNGLQNMIGPNNSAFYVNYIITISRLSTEMDYVMERYHKIVPKFVIPPSWVFQSLLMTMQNCKDPRYVPELYNEILTLRVPFFQDVAESLFSAMKENIPRERAEEFLSMIEKVEYWMDRFNHNLTSEIVSVVINVLCLCGNYEKIKEKLDQCVTLEIVPLEDTMLNILELTSNDGNKEGTLDTLKAMANFNMDYSERIKKIVDDSFLSDKRQNINSWFGVL